MSENFFEKLTPVKRGMRPGEVASPERIQALQDGLLALWEGRNVTGRGMRVNRGGSGLNLEPIQAVENRQGHRFTPLFAHGKLRIGLGTVAVGFADGGRVIEPYYPKFEGARLDAAEAPMKSLADMEAGDYQVVVIFCFTDGRVKVVPADEEVEKQDDEWVVQVATFTKLAGGGVEKVVHKWRSDILICCGDISCASDSDSGLDSSEDGSDSDSDSDGSEPPFSDSSDDSDDSSSGGGDECCPEITVTASASVVGDCNTTYGGKQTFLVLVTATALGNPCGCRNAFFSIGFNGQRQYFNLGFGGIGTATGFFEVFASPCTIMGGTVCWQTSVNVAGDECSGLECCEGFTIQLPNLCNTSCDSSSDDSQDSSDDSGDPGSDDSTTSSSGVSSSEDPGSEKTAIVRLSNGDRVKLFCMEGTESWFFDWIEVELEGSVMKAVPLPDDFVDVCVVDTIGVASVFVPSGRRVAVDEGVFTLWMRVKGWVWPWQKTTVHVLLMGVRRGHDHGRLPRATEEELQANEKFLKMARP